MSTRFIITCETCDVDGPYIRRRHSRGILEQESAAKWFPRVDHEQAVAEWGEFLFEHEYHDLRLYTERYKRQQKQPSPPVQKPTHILLSDGSLEEIES